MRKESLALENFKKNLENLKFKYIFEVADKARELGFLNETKYRNLLICMEFQELREKGITVEQSCFTLSEKWTVGNTHLSPESINRIIYSDNPLGKYYGAK